MGYTFGDGDVAARRLEHLAGVYEPTSAALLQQWAPPRPRHAVDLGCGPGHTTLLLHRCSDAIETVGVDMSARYVDAARETARGVDGVSFVNADVSRALPPAATGAGLAYVRFLLTHLTCPADALGAWRSGLAADATIVVEELEWMRSEHPALDRYYGIVESVQRANGQDMHVGGRVEAMMAAAGWHVVHSEAARLRPHASAMALLHLLNLEALSADPALADVPADELARLGRSLERLARGEDEATIDYGMRQVAAVARRPPS